jgi:hypothetical protein
MCYAQWHNTLVSTTRLQTNLKAGTKIPDCDLISSKHLVNNDPAKQ